MRKKMSQKTAKNRKKVQKGEFVGLSDFQYFEDEDEKENEEERTPPFIQRD